MMAMLSPMLFDAPGSEESRPLKRFFVCLLTFPLVCAAALAGGWLLYSFADPYFGAVAITLPLAHFVVGAWLVYRLPSNFGKP